MEALTWALPLGAAVVSVGLHGHPEEAAAGLGDVVAAVQGGVVEHQLAIEADVLAAVIHAVRVWCLRGDKMHQTETPATALI